MGPEPRAAARRLRLARPFATAYILGLLSSIGPRLIKVLVLLSKRKLGFRAACLQIGTLLQRATGPHRFPTFCGLLVGGSALLQSPVRALINFLLPSLQPTITPLHPRQARRIARFVAAFVSASVSFSLLNGASGNSRPSSTATVSQPPSHLEYIKPGPFDDPPEVGSRETDTKTLKSKSLSRVELAGKTTDLTLFSVVRALDIIISSAWERIPSKTTSKFEFVARNTASALFCFSAATIMHAWIYSPSRLPQTYNRWISAAAALDHRLLIALRHARYGTWIYGKDTGMAPLLGSMCRDYGLPENMGDPAKTIPIPCELVHMGRGTSCEKHAFLRFCGGWVFAAKMYAPLQLMVLARHARKQRRIGEVLRLRLPLRLVLGAFADMARSSAFLGAFIAFFYYGVCLSRTRLGPKLFSYKTVAPQMWDSGLCVLAGSLLCGWTILIEQPRKRLEILFFVLPRAAATWVPRCYLAEHRWKEHLAFALSAAVVLTAAQDDARRVRGVLGHALNGLLDAERTVD